MGLYYHGAIQAEVAMIVRYYFQLNPRVVDQFGGHQYVTAQSEIPIDGYLPKLQLASAPRSHYRGVVVYHQLMSNSDRVIRCDEDGTSRYIKHREMAPESAVIDPEEFFLIKMRSVEL